MTAFSFLLLKIFMKYANIMGIHEEGEPFPPLFHLFFGVDGKENERLFTLSNVESSFETKA